jgi:AraC-like DNA-binding protein
LAEIEQREREQQQAIEQLQAEPEETLTAGQQLFRRICTLMTEQQPYTDENLNRDMLAQLLGTNAKYVVQAIHECSHGETVTDFITRYRLERVARLLKTTDDAIAIIGEMSGIPSRATLARLFRNEYGMTCTEFREVAREKQ